MSGLTAIVEKKKGKGAIVRLLSFECAKRAVRSKACGIEAVHSKRVVMRRDAYHSFKHSFQQVRVGEDRRGCGWHFRVGRWVRVRRMGGGCGVAFLGWQMGG